MNVHRTVGAIMLHYASDCRLRSAESLLLDEVYDRKMVRLRSWLEESGEGIRSRVCGIYHCCRCGLDNEELVSSSAFDEVIEQLGDG